MSLLVRDPLRPRSRARPQLERYYETFGRPWERQAWIKARVCAGDAALGAEIMSALTPFVFSWLTPSTTFAISIAGSSAGSSIAIADGHVPEPVISAAVIAMRDRIERELGPGDLESVLVASSISSSRRAISSSRTATHIRHCAPHRHRRRRDSPHVTDRVGRRPCSSKAIASCARASIA